MTNEIGASGGSGRSAGTNVTSIGIGRGSGGSGGGSASGGSGGGTTFEISLRDYVDLQSEKTKAQNDARFSEILSRLDRLPSLWQLFAVSAGSIATIFAILAFASDRFDGGLAASAILDAAANAQVERDAIQDAKLDTIIQNFENYTVVPK